MKKKASIQVIPSIAMRADVWRSAPELVDYASKLFASPQFRTMLQVVKNESPANFKATDDKAEWSGMVQGYTYALQVMESLGAVLKAPVTLEATFEPPEKP